MSSPVTSQQIIGEAPAFLEMLEHVSRAATLSKPVLVVGERGTGKELIASRLHFLSNRWEQRVVKVNCAALTESILESELFGHEAGAFTGAATMHIGHFERADSGTLILDELATISLRMQEKILRAIEYGEIQRVGGSDTLQVDVRIVGSTNADLPQLAAEGHFRKDLLDRLAFDVVTVPPLRERVEDIMPLAHAFAINMASELKWTYFPGFGPRVSSALLRNHWPGNVRELKNTIERTVYRAADPEKAITRLALDPYESAATMHIGHFERADSGTLILDELATISLRMQEKILRAIEYGEIQRVGGSDTLQVDVRIVGSTNADLPQLAAEGHFRKDLLDRLAFDVVTVPPLRERVEDIMPLAHAFAINMASELKWTYFPGFGPRVSSALLRNQWPGNVRELKNTIERTVYRAADPEKAITRLALDPFDSPFKIERSTSAGPVVATTPKRSPLLPADLTERLKDIEVDLLTAALEKARFNQRMAADLLGLGYHQFRGKLRKYDIRSKP